MEKFQNSLKKVVEPITDRITNNMMIQSLTDGFLAIMPVQLGTAIIAVLSNLPIPAWQKLLNDIGAYQAAQDMIALTLSLIALYIVGAVAFGYAKRKDKNGVIASTISLAAFMSLMPIKEFADGTRGLLLSNLGGDGVFVAMIVSLLVSWLYCFLLDKNIKFSLPESVPPMVADSLSTTFVSMIIFTLIFFVRWLVTLTAFGDVFTFITEIVASPVMSLGASPWAVILMYTLQNLIWFFGVHPSPISKVFIPIMSAAGLANIEAFSNGEPLPFLLMQVAYVACFIGGFGNTLGLCIATLFAKSEKYKAMRKVVIPANIFNINEPIIFGFPLMLNPIYFIPMVTSSAISGTVAVLLAKVLPIHMNPTIRMPWITPGPITTTLQGGIWFTVIWTVCLFICFLLYLPFFLIDDKRALEEEKKSEEEIASAN